MVRFLLGAFIVAHGLLTALIWASSPKADAPFRATHSWLLGDARPLASRSRWWPPPGSCSPGSASSWIGPGGLSSESVPGGRAVVMTLFFSPAAAG